MIRKNALSLIVTVLLVVTALVALPIASAVSDSSPASGHPNSVLLDDFPTPTPTIEGGTNSNPSGGGNGGG